MTDSLLAPKQMEFILNSVKNINIAHGSVRASKTVGSLFRFMQACDECPDNQIWMIGHTSSTIFDNAIKLILEKSGGTRSDPFATFRPFCTWRKGDRKLLYKDKVISTVGAKDGGAIGAIQGKSMSLVYCDEMTLFPDNIIDMLDTRLSNPYSMLIGTCNPSYPTHKIKQWIDKAKSGDPNYYELKFTLDDNPYLTQAYKDRIKNSLSGVFYKRNYLGEWCLAEGAVFDFFDRNLYVVKRPPKAADYYICSVDYGTSNAFAALIIGINCGKYDQTKPMWWVEKEYYWDSKKTGKQKTSGEYAEDLKDFIAPYGVTSVYLDPSALSFKVELSRHKIHVVRAENDVVEGILKTIDMVRDGQLLICENCTNLIREIEGYVWDPKCAEKGKDEPLKRDDHAIDALRYAANTHKPARFDHEDYYKQLEQQQRQQTSWGWKQYSNYGQGFRM